MSHHVLLSAQISMIYMIDHVITTLLMQAVHVHSIICMHMMITALNCYSQLLVILRWR